MSTDAQLPQFALALPGLTLAPGTFLMREGTRSGRVFVLESGALVVLREGVTLARIDRPGALVGEMAVLLSTNHSASVQADGPVTVRVLDDAGAAFARDPELALHVARMALGRLNATSALLVELQHAARHRPAERQLLDRIFGALSGTGGSPAGGGSGRGPRIDHE